MNLKTILNYLLFFNHYYNILFLKNISNYFKKLYKKCCTVLLLVICSNWFEFKHV